MSPLLALVARDLRLALRTPGDSATVVAFFVISVAMFPFGVGPEPQLLARIASGVIWVTALLACLLSLDRLFALDHEDGSLDLILLAAAPVELTVLAKCLAHWLIAGLPLVITSPLLALVLNLPLDAWPTLLAALALGTPILSLIGAIGAALVLGARRGGVLLPLLVLPLAIPAVIFGAAAIEAAGAGLSPAPFLLLLGAGVSLALPLAPLAAGAALTAE